jgi:hypothetical protein
MSEEQELITREMDESTPERIAKQYQAALDSVNLINNGKASWMSDEEWEDALKRNKDHLIYILTKDWWTTEDLTPLQMAAGI